MTVIMRPAKQRGILAVRADAGGDVGKTLAALSGAFEEFKSTQQAQAKDKDVLLDEKLDRINSAMSDMQGAVDQANARIEAMKANGGAGNGVKDPEYTEAFRAHFRKGEFQASLNKGADAEGGYLAPTEWDRTITDKLVEVSPMRQLATVQTISTPGFKKLFNLRGATSGWVGEEAARPETNTPEFGSMTFTPGEIYANPAATQQMLDDAEVNLEAWLAGEVETEFAYQEGLAFVSGNGTNKPAGFLTFATGAANAATNPLGAIEKVTAAAAAAVTSDEIVDLIYSLPSAYTQNARFVMNRDTQKAIRKLKDGDGNYLWQPSFVAGQPATLAGYGITEMAAMPDIAASALPIAFGDFRRGYLIVERAGIRVLRDPYTNKPFVHFYTTKRVGGGVKDPQCIKVLGMAAI